MNPPALVEHFFRHEYGRLVATLVRRVGVQHLGAVEDAVQSALTTALEVWTVSGRPEHAEAWLFRVAFNELFGQLRKNARRQHILDAQVAFESEEVLPAMEPRLAGEVQDDLLRLLFVCCNESIPEASQLMLALKTLCGFSVREISQRTFVSEASVYKRLERARVRLAERTPDLDGLSAAQYELRLASVQRVLYLLFTEGYLSCHHEQAIRKELCAEAIRLATLLAEHPVGQAPESYALLALMHLHSARLRAREDLSGGLVLLQDQDRTLTDQAELHVGLQWLARSAQGGVFSRYHAEAGIAAEHGLAPSFEETRWDRIVDCYVLLDRVAPSAIHTLNRAVAVAECKGPAAGLAVLAGLEPPSWLAGSYLWAAVHADLHARAGHASQAARYRDLALSAAPSPAVRALLQRRF